MDEKVSHLNITESMNDNHHHAGAVKLMPLEIPMSKWAVPLESPIDAARGALSRNFRPPQPLSISHLISTGSDKVPQFHRMITTWNISPPPSGRNSSGDQDRKSSGVAGRFKCVCGACFEKKDDFYDHYSNECVSNFNVCEICSRAFARRQDLKHHMQVHVLQNVTCDGCGFKFTRQPALNRHKRHCKKL